MSFDCVTSAGIVVGAATNNTTLLLENIASSGHYSYNFTGDGAYGFFGFLEGTNQSMQLDNIKLVANDIHLVTADVKTYSDYYPYGMQLPYRKGADGDYRYGFQGQEMDNEIKGDGNSVNFEYRMHDPRLGRFFAIDPLAPQYPHNSPYAFSENRVMDAIELEGLEAKLIITNDIVGYTPQYIYGDLEHAIDNGSMIVVPVYSMKLVDANTGEVMGTFGVTRDGWYSRGISHSDDNGNDVQITNRYFEAKDPEKNLYSAVALEYPPNSGLDALALRQYGSETLKAEAFTKETNSRINGLMDHPREKLDEAEGVMIHIGGWYDNGKTIKLAGSYGCFAVIPSDQIYAKEEHAQSMIDYNAVGKHGTANDYFNNFMAEVQKVLRNTKGEKKYLITVEDRKNVQKTQVLQDQGQ